MTTYNPDFTSYRAFLAEGARVAITSCMRCGVALLLDPENKVDVVNLHLEWHVQHP